MKHILAIAGRELEAYFATAIGWLCLGGFIFLTGIVYTWIAFASSDTAMMGMGEPPSVNEYLLPGFFGTAAVILLFMTPALSMRLFAEDVKQRSIELLLSSPVTSLEIVLGKYLGSLGFLGVLMLGTAHYMAITFWLSSPDPMVILANYLSTFLLGASCLAVGLLTSAMTRSQLVALVLSFGTLLTLWFLGGMGDLLEGTAGEVLTNLSVLTHMEEMSRGLLHIKDVVYYVSFIGFFLFATLQRVEAMRWQ